MKLLNCVLICLLFTACNNNSNIKTENQTVAGDDPVTGITDAYNVTVKTLNSKSKDADAGIYTVEVDNLNKKTKKPYRPIYIASESAEIIFKSFTAEEANTVQSIHIIINSIFKKDLYEYKIADLKRKDAFLKIAKSGVENILKGNYDEFYAMADEKYFPKDAYDNYIKTNIKPNVHVFKGVDEIEDGGFTFKELEGVKVCQAYFVTTSSDNIRVEFEITLTDTDTPKVVGIYTNELKN